MQKWIRGIAIQIVVIPRHWLYSFIDPIPFLVQQVFGNAVTKCKMKQPQKTSNSKDQTKADDRKYVHLLDISKKDKWRLLHIETIIPEKLAIFLH